MRRSRHTTDGILVQLLRADASTAAIALSRLEAAGPGYSERGASVSLMQPLSPELSTWVEYDLRTALRGNGDLVMTDLAEGLTPQTAPAASVGLRGRIAHTSTVLRLEYRWQPLNTLTQVNAYNVVPEEAYMSFYIRQRLWCGRMLPQGLDAVVEVTNLIEEGYQPVLSPDRGDFVSGTDPTRN